MFQRLPLWFLLFNNKGVPQPAEGLIQTFFFESASAATRYPDFDYFNVFFFLMVKNPIASNTIPANK